MKNNKIILFLITIFSVINIFGQCDADFFWEIPTSCTTYDTVKFYDNSTNAITWYWDFGDSTSSNIQFPIHHYNNLGIYNVCLIITDGTSCSDTIFKPVVISSCLTDFSYVPINKNRKIQFFDKPSFSYIPANYIWDFGDSTYSYQRLPTHTYNQEGLYNVTLTIYDSTNYCYQKLVKKVRIYQPINTKISISNGDWSNPYTWLDSIIPNNNDSIIICNDLNINTDITLLSPGLLYINKNASLCGHQTFTGKLITYGELNLDYVEINDTSYSDFIPINCLNGFSISLGTYMTQYYPTSYTFSCLSTIENINIDYFKIYPNPTSGKLFINYDFAKSTKQKIKIYNLVGELIKTDNIENSKGIYQTDFSNFARGIYYINISNDEFTKTVRVVYE